MNSLKIIAISTFFISYLILLGLLIFRFNDYDLPLPVIFAWFLGIISVFTNSLLSVKKNQNKWITVLCVVSGIVWLYFPLLLTSFGILFLSIHIIIILYINLKTRITSN